MVGFQPRTPLVAALALAGVLTQSPEELLRRSDVGAFAPSSFRARLVLKNLPQGASHEVEVWRSGEAKTLIRFLDPKERGKYLLRLRRTDLAAVSQREEARPPESLVSALWRRDARRGPRHSPRPGVPGGERLTGKGSRRYPRRPRAPREVGGHALPAGALRRPRGHGAARQRDLPAPERTGGHGR